MAPAVLPSTHTLYVAFLWLITEQEDRGVSDERRLARWRSLGGERSLSAALVWGSLRFTKAEKKPEGRFSFGGFRLLKGSSDDHSGLDFQLEGKGLCRMSEETPRRRRRPQCPGVRRRFFVGFFVVCWCECVCFLSRCCCCCCCSIVVVTVKSQASRCGWRINCQVSRSWN